MLHTARYRQDQNYAHNSFLLEKSFLLFLAPLQSGNLEKDLRPPSYGPNHELTEYSLVFVVI